MVSLIHLLLRAKVGITGKSNRSRTLWLVYQEGQEGHSRHLHPLRVDMVEIEIEISLHQDQDRVGVMAMAMAMEVEGRVMGPIEGVGGTEKGRGRGVDHQKGEWQIVVGQVVVTLPTPVLVLVLAPQLLDQIKQTQGKDRQSHPDQLRRQVQISIHSTYPLSTPEIHRLGRYWGRRGRIVEGLNLVRWT